MYILTLNGGYIKPLKLQNIGKKYTFMIVYIMTGYIKGGFLMVAAIIVLVVFVKENRQCLFCRLVLRRNIQASVVVVNYFAFDF